MVVQAYILIQTEVGKAAAVAREIAERQGRHAGRGRHRPVRRDRPRRGQERRRARQDGRREGAGRRRHHPDADLPRRPPLSRLGALRPPAAAAASAVVCALAALAWRGRRWHRPSRGLLVAGRPVASVPARRSGAAAVRALHDALPSDGRRPTRAAHRRPPSTRTAAWGDPAGRAALRGRHARPGSTPTSELIEVDGVDVVPRRARPRRTSSPTVGRGAYLEVRVPGGSPGRGRRSWPSCRPWSPTPSARPGQLARSGRADGSRASAQAGSRRSARSAPAGRPAPGSRARSPPTAAGTSTPA